MSLPHEPTDETRAMVEQWKTDGITKQSMCDALRITYKTLVKHYADQLVGAEDDFEIQFERALKARALQPDCPPAIMIFTAKARLGWRETVPVDPYRDRELGDLSDDELLRLLDKRRRADAPTALIEE